MTDTQFLNYNSVFNSIDGQQVLAELIQNFYNPILKQNTVEDTYFRLGQADVLSFILSRIEQDKQYILGVK